ncbi:unnamed protein product [Callosobruchus maculatus]|uniref:Uncharacterized protein n=1 Tax=Callosobruchus maculatus TaxID=64391 RepID=A0A653BYH3_CALMS|nr:unnamed protein product [Callosobruchus maculatus]
MNLVYVIALLSVLSSSQAAYKLNVTIYYETLSPECSMFIQSQLHPVYSKFADYLRLDMVPFGIVKSKFDEETQRWTFACEHGPDECYGNVIHACALDLNPPKTALDFINCCERQANPATDEAFQKCAKEIGINFEDLKRCKETTGYRHQVANAKKSRKIGLSTVPFITLNDKRDDDLNSEACQDFEGFVCKQLADNPPKGCQSLKN